MALVPQLLLQTVEEGGGGGFGGLDRHPFHPDGADHMNRVEGDSPFRGV